MVPRPISRGSLVARGGLVMRVYKGWRAWFHTSPWYGHYLRAYARGLSANVVYIGRHKTGRRNMPKRPELRAEAAKQVKAFPVEGSLLKFPLLAGYLADMYYEADDGQEPQQRQPSSLLIFPAAGCIRAILKDPSAGLQLRVQVDRWDDLLLTIELLLASSPTPWEPDVRPDMGRKGGKK